MDPLALQLEARNTIVLADELSRLAHAQSAHVLSGRLAALRSSIQDLERDMGLSAPPEPSVFDPGRVAAVERALESLLVRRDHVPATLHARFEHVIASAERISIALWDPSAAVPSKPVMGLPTARIVPQAAGSVADLVGSGLMLASAAVARTRRARIVGAVLGIGGGALALASDTTIGVKRIPIETTMRATLAGDVLAVAAPFVLGYARRDPLAAAMQVATGLVGIALAFVTDWRGTDGATTPVRRGGRVASPVGIDAVRAPPLAP